MCELYHKRIVELENKKFDLEKEVEFRDFQVEWAPWRARLMHMHSSLLYITHVNTVELLAQQIYFFLNKFFMYSVKR